MLNQLTNPSRVLKLEAPSRSGRAAFITAMYVDKLIVGSSPFASMGFAHVKSESSPFSAETVMARLVLSSVPSPNVAAQQQCTG